jgi:hypothetical protein
MLARAGLASGGEWRCLMTRSVRTLPFAFVSGGDPKFSLTNRQWKQIERAYGDVLAANVRQAIVEATINYLLFESFERAAEPVSLTRRKVLAVQKAAKNLYDALVTAPATTAMIYAHLIARDRDRNEFVRLLPPLAGACASVLARLDDPNLPGHRERDCWRDWVRALTRIANQRKLPTGAHDTDKTWGPSPFVVLVRELQRHVPPEARRHGGSDVALAKAIQRARQDEA